MRCAERGPTPGNTRSASTSNSSPFAVGTASRLFKAGSSKRQLESRRQTKTGGHAAHLLRDRSLDAVSGIIKRGGNQIFQHLAVITDERRIDRHALNLVFAGHLHLHHAGARLALDLEGGKAF